MSILDSACRQLLNKPSSTLISVLTLALGIGAATAVFSLVDRLLFHALPFPESDNLVEVYHRRPDRPTPTPASSIPRFNHYRREQTVFTDIAASVGDAMALTGAGDPVQLFGQRITSNYFAVLGVKPFLGRLFTSEEEKSGNTAVVVSDRFWKSKLLSDPHVIGRLLTLNGVSHTIIGVIPAFPRNWGGDTDVWTTWPFSLRGYTDAELARGVPFLNVVGRLKTGGTRRQAQSEMDLLSNRYETSFSSNTDSKRVVVLMGAQEEVTQAIKTPLVLFSCASVCLLLIGCSNIANLLLARFADRQREVALRAALGSSLGEIVKLFLTESLCYGLLGGVGGVMLAAALLKLVPVVASGDFASAADVSLNLAGLGFALGLSLVTGLLVGVFPALQATRHTLTDTLKQGGRSSTPSRASRLFRSALIAGQIATALTLVVGAGVLVKTFANLQQQTLGFQSERVFTAAVDLPTVRYPNSADRSRFADRLLSEIAHSPEIESAAVVLGPPFSGSRTSDLVARTDDPRPLNERPGIYKRSCTSGYFKTLGISLLAGRDFNGQDTTEGAKVMIISEAMGLRFFPGENPIGQRLLVGSADGKGTPMEVIGVVGSVRSMALSKAPEEEYYRPWSQQNISYLQIVARVKHRAEDAAGEVRAAVTHLDPLLPIMRQTTLDTQISDSLGQNRLLTSVVSFFGILALLLALSGIYSVAAYDVSQRTEEIGIRIALGAQASDVVKLILHQALKPAIVGTLIGIALVFASKRLLASQLYGISALDPLVLGFCVILIHFTTALASLWPALRATRIDPARALRNE